MSLTPRGTVAAARADGLAAQELWEGLGEVRAECGGVHGFL